MKTIGLIAFSLLVFYTSPLAAHDCGFMGTFEERVFSVENPETHARDMVTDWMFDHRAQIVALDPETLSQGEDLVQWMDAHGFSLSKKCLALYCKISDRVKEKITESLREFVKNSARKHVEVTVVKPAIPLPVAKTCSTGH